VYKAYVGAFKTSIQTYHLKWIVSGRVSTSFTPYLSIPSTSGYPAGGNNLTTAFGSDCTLIFTDLMEQQQTPIFLSAVNGWSSILTNKLWAMNASQLTNLGEAQDLYCHFIYVGGFLDGAYIGLSLDRVPILQYNIATGELVELEWPYNH